jgi:predicted nucleotidyltransferase
MLKLIEQHREQLAALCRRYGVRRLDLFGSATRDDFDLERSDLDFAVEFDDLAARGAADRYFGLLVDLQDLFGRRVDLVSVTGVRNPYFRQVLEETRVPLYAAA